MAWVLQHGPAVLQVDFWLAVARNAMLLKQLFTSTRPIKLANRCTACKDDAKTGTTSDIVTWSSNQLSLAQVCCTERRRPFSDGHS